MQGKKADFKRRIAVDKGDYITNCEALIKSRGWQMSGQELKNPEEEDIRTATMEMKTAGFSCVDESMSDTMKTMVETKAAEISAFSDEGVAMRAIGSMQSFAEDLAIEEKQKEKEDALK